MNSFVKKFVSYMLLATVLFFTVMGLLGIWGLINFEDVFLKVMTSLLVVFVATSIVLFIFAVLIKDKEPKS
jgi:hypothetical protein